MNNEIHMITDTDKEIEEILDTLTKDYGMSTECLSHLLGVKSDGHKVEVPTYLCIYRILKHRLMYHGKSRPDRNEGCPEQLG